MTSKEKKHGKLSKTELEAIFLEPSPYASDGGNLIGKNPLSMDKSDLLLLGGPTTLKKAIRLWCIECSGDSQSEARKCTAFRCPLWAFRMGKNPYDPRFKRKHSNAA